MPVKIAIALLAVLLPLSAFEMRYPVAPRGNVVDDYHGIRVPDPYRWLEDPDSPESRKWIAAENVLTNSFLANVSNMAALKSRLGALWSPVSYPPGFANRNNRYFFLRRDTGKNQPILYWMKNRSAAPQVLLDPNTLSADGTAALESWSVSRDGKLLSYGIARAGSDWQDIHFRSVDSLTDLPDKLEWTKFSTPEWAMDNGAVYYSRFPKPADNQLLTSANFNQQLYLHKLGTPQAADKLIYERPDHKDWEFEPVLSEDGRYLVIVVLEGTRRENLIYYQDLHAAPGKIVELIGSFDAEYVFLDSRGTKLYFQTTKEAPKSRVIAIDIAAQNSVSEIVPQSANVLDQAVLLNDSLFLAYSKDVATQLLVRRLDGGSAREVPLPAKGHAEWAEHGPQHAPQNREQFFWFESFTQPTLLYSLDVHSLNAKAFGKSELPFDASQFETKQVFYPSKDGTRIPMFLIGRKGFQPNPNTPCLLYGYGGFNISVTPQYSPLFLEWVELGGIVAVANLRGGAEYGEQWHQAGMKLKKQNVFDDFIAAAQWLTANQYTSKSKLGIYGRSNGGLLIGAVLNQRPDLFGAAVPGVGVMDMLRFHKFTVGYGWISDYGSPDNPVEFKAIRAYSPLHNIRKGGRYPPTLILTADHDDRVVPGHSFKYAAELQHDQSGPAPVLIRIETSAGHGGGKPITKRVDEAAAIIAFLEKSLGMPE